jgi:hypothetical protein
MPATDEKKNEILRFLQQVDAGVSSLLAGETAPLLLAGVNYLLPIYHEANSYPHIVKEGIAGNPDEMEAVGLYHRAWEIVASRFAEEREAAAAAYLHLAGTGDERASADLTEIVPAAYFERVDQFFVPVNVERWGRFHPASGKVEIHDKREVGDQDLMDLAAIHTLLNAGMVYAVEPDQVPGKGPVAAILRF